MRPPSLDSTERGSRPHSSARQKKDASLKRRSHMSKLVAVIGIGTAVVVVGIITLAPLVVV